MTTKPSADAAIPDPPWRAARRERPTRTPLTREAIVDAAIRVVDRDGADGLSMRRVAEELGAGPASLYWHVANKNELIILMVERITGPGPSEPPDPARWQEQLKTWGLEVRRNYRQHPGVGALTLGRIPVGPGLAQWAEWMLALLRGAGVPDRIAAYAGDLLGLYVGAIAYEEALGPPSPTGEDLPPEEVLRMMREYFTSLPPERFPNLLATMDHLVAGGPDERFELGLDVILRGLASYIERP